MKKLLLALLSVAAVPCIYGSVACQTFPVPYRVLHVGMQYLMPSGKSGVVNQAAAFFSPVYYLFPETKLVVNSSNSVGNISYYFTASPPQVTTPAVEVKSNLFVKHNVTLSDFDSLQKGKQCHEVGGNPNILSCVLTLTAEYDPTLTYPGCSGSTRMPVLVENTIRPLSVAEQVAAKYGDTGEFLNEQIPVSAIDYRQISMNPKDFPNNTTPMPLVALPDYFVPVKKQGAVSYSFSAGSSTHPYLCAGLTDASACANHPAVYLTSYAPPQGGNYFSSPTQAAAPMQSQMAGSAACPNARFYIGAATNKPQYPHRIATAPYLYASGLCAGEYQINIKATQGQNVAFTSFYVNVNSANPSIQSWWKGAAPVSNLFSASHQHLSPIYTYPGHGRSPGGHYNTGMPLFIKDQTMYANALSYVNQHILKNNAVNVVMPSVAMLQLGTLYVQSIKASPNWPMNKSIPGCQTATAADPRLCITATGVETSYQSDLQLYPTAGFPPSSGWWRPVEQAYANSTPAVHVAGDYGFDKGLKAALPSFTPKQAAYLAAVMINIDKSSGLVGSSLDPETGFTGHNVLQVLSRMSDMFFYQGLWLGYYEFARDFSPGQVDALSPAGMPFFSVYDATGSRPPLQSTKNNPHTFPFVGATGYGQGWSLSNANVLYQDVYVAAATIPSGLTQNCVAQSNTKHPDGIYTAVSWCSISANGVASGNYNNLYSPISTGVNMAHSPMQGIQDFNGHYTAIMPLGGSATAWDYVEIWNPDFSKGSGPTVMMNYSACTGKTGGDAITNFWLEKHETELLQKSSKDYEHLAACLFNNIEFANPSSKTSLTLFANKSPAINVNAPTPAGVHEVTKCDDAGTASTYTCQVSLTWKSVSTDAMAVSIVNNSGSAVFSQSYGAGSAQFTYKGFEPNVYYRLQLAYSTSAGLGPQYLAANIVEGSAPPPPKGTVPVQLFQACPGYPFYECMLVSGMPADYAVSLGVPAISGVMRHQGAIQNIIAASQTGRLNIYPYTRHLVGYGAFAMSNGTANNIYDAVVSALGPKPSGTKKSCVPGTETGISAMKCNQMIQEPWYSMGVALSGQGTNTSIDPFYNSALDQSLLKGEWEAFAQANSRLYSSAAGGAG